MKRFSIIFALFTLPALTFQAPSGYLEIMQKNIEALYAAQTIEQYQSAVNTFSRIAQAEKEEWHPLYYATFGYIMMSTRTDSAPDKDKFLDRANEILKEAIRRKQDESELIALKGFIHMMRITVDPATRGQQYSGMAMEEFNKAVQLNSENPRALYLLAQMEMGTARFFGSDTTAACATLDKAIALFENFKPAHPLDPAWGMEGAKAAKQQCQ